MKKECVVFFFISVLFIFGFFFVGASLGGVTEDGKIYDGVTHDGFLYVNSYASIPSQGVALTNDWQEFTFSSPLEVGSSLTLDYFLRSGMGCKIEYRLIDSDGEVLKNSGNSIVTYKDYDSSEDISKKVFGSFISPGKLGSVSDYKFVSKIQIKTSGNQYVYKNSNKQELKKSNNLCSGSVVVRSVNSSSYLIGGASIYTGNSIVLNSSRQEFVLQDSPALTNLDISVELSSGLSSIFSRNCVLYSEVHYSDGVVSRGNFKIQSGISNVEYSTLTENSILSRGKKVDKLVLWASNGCFSGSTSLLLKGISGHSFYELEGFVPSNSSYLLTRSVSEAKRVALAENRPLIVIGGSAPCATASNFINEVLLSPEFIDYASKNRLVVLNAYQLKLSDKLVSFGKSLGCNVGGGPIPFFIFKVNDDANIYSDFNLNVLDSSQVSLLEIGEGPYVGGLSCGRYIWSTRNLNSINGVGIPYKGVPVVVKGVAGISFPNKEFDYETFIQVLESYFPNQYWDSINPPLIVESEYGSPVGIGTSDLDLGDSSEVSSGEDVASDEESSLVVDDSSDGDDPLAGEDSLNDFNSPGVAENPIFFDSSDSVSQGEDLDGGNLEGEFLDDADFAQGTLSLEEDEAMDTAGEENGAFDSDPSATSEDFTSESSSASGGSAFWVTPSTCPGCFLDGKCYSLGYRSSKNYCSEYLSFVEQKESGEVCDNNFECTSNFCVDGSCVNSGLLQRIMNFLNGFGSGF